MRREQRKMCKNCVCVRRAAARVKGIERERERERERESEREKERVE